MRDSLATYVELRFPELQADLCVCLAAVATREGELEHAARLLGAAASIRQSGGTVEPAVLVHLESVTAAGQAGLGDDAFAAGFGRGRASPGEVLEAELGDRRPTSGP